jgi:hypothetical protein
MLLFKRIFDFPRATLARLRNKRRAVRYAVAPGFPLKAVVNLLGSDQPARAQVARGSGRDWGGAILDLSGTGLRLGLPPAATTTRGEPSVLTLTLDDFQLRVPCTVAHFRVQAAGSLCGLSLEFENDTQRKGYQQLLEAVVLGAGFAPVKVSRDKSGFLCERYRSEGKAVLTAWREPAGGRLHGFELVLGEHAVRSVPGAPALDVLTGVKTSLAAATGAEKQEILRLYRIVAANLPGVLPADLRELMQGFAKAAPAASRR